MVFVQIPEIFTPAYLRSSTFYTNWLFNLLQEKLRLLISIKSSGSKSAELKVALRGLFLKHNPFSRLKNHLSRISSVELTLSIFLFRSEWLHSLHSNNIDCQLNKVPLDRFYSWIATAKSCSYLILLLLASISLQKSLPPRDLYYIKY